MCERSRIFGQSEVEGGTWYRGKRYTRRGSVLVNYNTLVGDLNQPAGVMKSDKGEGGKAAPPPAGSLAILHQHSKTYVNIRRKKLSSL